MPSDGSGRTSGRRLLWAGALFAALLPILFHLQYVSGDRILYWADTAQLQFPRYKILCDALQNEGRLPAWQTLLYTGSPFHANPENPTLYPPVLLLASFCTPVWTINLTILTHLSLAALGMFFLVRRLWLRVDLNAGSSAIATAGAIVGACAFSLSYWTRTDHLNLVAYGATHALIPWVLLAADSLLEGPHPRRSAGVLGLLLGFQVLTGGLYVIPYAAIALSMWMFFLGICAGRERARRTLTYGVLALLFAALIVSGKYLPYQEWVAVTNRAARLDYAEALGTTLGTRGNQGFLWDEVLKRLTWYTFFGATIGLALLALPLLRLGVVRLSFGLVVLFFLISLGGPVHRFLFDYVPIFDQTRNAVRAWSGVNAFLPLLAGLGVCALLARMAGLRERPIAVCGIGALIAAILAPCLSYSFRFEEQLTHPERFSELPKLYTNWPDAAKNCGKDWRAMYVDRDSPRSRNEQFISTLLEVETPAGYLGHVWPRDLELHLYGTQDDPLSDEIRFRRRSTLSVKWLISTSHAPNAPKFSTLVKPGNDEGTVDGNVLIPNTLARARAIEPSVVLGIFGDVKSEVAYAALDHGTFPLMEASCVQFAADRALSADELAALDGLVVCGTPSPQALAAAKSMRERPPRRTPDVVPGRVVEVSLPLSDEQRESVLALEHELALDALEREPAIDKFERLRSDATVVTRMDSARGRWLVVSEPWSVYTGWTAKANSGAPRAIERADGVSSAVFMPVGETSLRADYAPKSVRTGLWLFAAGVICALLVACWPVRRSVRTR